MDRIHKIRVAYIILTLFILCFFLVIRNMDVHAEPWNGEVDTSWYTEHEYEQYLYISTPEELAGLAQLVNGKNELEGYVITLTNDIYLNNVEWTQIGQSSIYQQFKGTFDGNGHTIYGLNISSGTGLFGAIGDCGTVKKLTVEGNINTSDMFVGGISGRNDGTISECCSKINVIAEKYVGGICSYNDGTIINCYNLGDLKVNDRCVAGISYLSNGGKIINCYNIGNLSGNSISGIACQNCNLIDGSFCMSGKGANYLCEQNIGNVTNSKLLQGYEFKSQTYFTEAGWDFTDVWYMGENYPELKSYKPHVHSEIIDEAISPTCTETGLTEGSHCSVCGEVLVKQVVRDSIGHSLTSHDAEQATCTEDGNNEYWSCDNCNKYFSDSEGKDEVEESSWVIPAAGHKMTEHAAEPATCLKDGNNEYWSCENCNKYYADSEGKEEIEESSWIIPATGHKMTEHAAEPATCIEDGNNEYWSCDNCNKYYADSERKEEIEEGSWVIPATGHKMTDHPAVPATYKETGNSEYWSCENCNKYYADSEGKTIIEKNSWVIPMLTPTPTATPTLIPTSQPTPVVTPSVTPATKPSETTTIQPTVSPTVIPTPVVVKDKKTTFSIKNKATIKNKKKIKIKDKDKIKKVTLNGKNIKIKTNKTSITVKLKSYKKYLKKKGKWNTLKVIDKKGNSKSIRFKTK